MHRVTERWAGERTLAVRSFSDWSATLAPAVSETAVRMCDVDALIAGVMNRVEIQQIADHVVARLDLDELMGTVIAEVDVGLIADRAMTDVDLTPIADRALQQLDLDVVLARALNDPVDITQIVLDRVDLRRVIDSALDQLDLTQLVLDQVDLGANRRLRRRERGPPRADPGVDRVHGLGGGPRRAVAGRRGGSGGGASGRAGGRSANGADMTDRPIDLPAAAPEPHWHEHDVPREARAFQGRPAGIVTRGIAATVDGLAVLLLVRARGRAPRWGSSSDRRTSLFRARLSASR